MEAGRPAVEVVHSPAAGDRGARHSPRVADVREVLRDTAQRAQGLAEAGALRRAGVSPSSLSRAVAAGEAVRVRRRVYALAPLPPLPRWLVTDDGVAPAYAAHVRAVLLSMGDQAAACLRTAAALHGWGLLVEPARTIEVLVPHGHGSRRAAGVSVVQRRSAVVLPTVVLPGTEPLRLTSPTQTAVDCALALPLVQAVVVADSALRSGVLSLADLCRAARSLPGVRDAARVRRVLELCDPASGSVLESVLRVGLALAGLPAPTTQRVLRDRPQLRVDFCFQAARLVVEVDGARWHQDPAADRARDNALAVLGWRVLRYTWADVVHDGVRVVREVREALGAGTPTLHPAGLRQQAAA